MPRINLGDTAPERSDQGAMERAEEEAELAVRFDEDRERLRKLHETLRNIEGPSDFIPFKSGILNKLYNDWLAIGLELSSGTTSQNYIIEKMVSLMRGLEDARRKDDLDIRPDKPWPFVEEDTQISRLNEDAKRAMGIER